MESGNSGAGGRVMLDQWLDPAVWKAEVHEAIRIARVNLDSVPALQRLEVVLGSGWPGSCYMKLSDTDLKVISTEEDIAVFGAHR